MKNYIKTIALCLSAIALGACESDNRDGMTASLEYREIEVSTNKLTLSARENSRNNFDIKSNNATWSIETTEKWIHLDIQEGNNTQTINVTADKYTNPEADRNGMIIVKSSVTGWDYADTIIVTQSKSLPFVNIPKEEYDISANGGELIIPIGANVEWEASLASNYDWITLEKVDSTQLKVIVKQTTSAYERNAILDLKPKGSSYTPSIESFKIIKIRQLAPTVETKEKEYEISAKGGELIIPVEADVEWEASTNCDWILLEKVNSTHLKVIVYQTKYTYSRNTTVDFKLAGSLSITLTKVKITQLAPIIKTEQNKYEFLAKGEERIIPVEADVNNWDLKASNYDWLTIEKINDTQIKAIVKPTTSTSTRSATIGLKMPDSTNSIYSFSIEQEAGKVSASESRFEFDKDGGSKELIVEANTDWNIEVGNPTWISVSKDKGTAGRSTLTINVEKMSSYRSSNIYMKIGNTRCITITINQK